MERLNILGIESPDPTLSFLGAVGLAASVRTALVVDLTGGLKTSRTLADLADGGPSLVELGPGRAGVALVSGGGLGDEQSQGLVEVLAARWPAVVVRCQAGGWHGPTVPLRAILPGALLEVEGHPAVWQPWGPRAKPPGPGPILPRLGLGLTRQLLSGRLPARSRWIKAWTEVWGMPWA